MKLGSATGLTSSVQTSKEINRDSGLEPDLQLLISTQMGILMLQLAPGWNALYANGTGDNGVVEIFLGGQSHFPAIMVESIR